MMLFQFRATVVTVVNDIKIEIFMELFYLYLSQVNVYASNPWHESMTGKIRNLVIFKRIERTMGRMQNNHVAELHTLPFKSTSEIGDDNGNGVETNNTTSCPKGPSSF